MAPCSAWWGETREVGGDPPCPRHRAGQEASAAQLSGPAPRSASTGTAFFRHPGFGRGVGRLYFVPLCMSSRHAYVDQTLHPRIHWLWCSVLPARVSEAPPGGQVGGRSVLLSGNSPPGSLSTAQLPTEALKPSGSSRAQRSRAGPALVEPGAVPAGRRRAGPAPALISPPVCLCLRGPRGSGSRVKEAEGVALPQHC